MLRVGSDFSGVGAFNQALIRLGVEYKEVFACDMDKFARETFIHNYGEPEYYPTNVYDREIPSESLDIYMTSPPCQAFSLAGKRLGKDDKRGILFFNSHEFIQVNKPRFFIFENVKGLLSDDGGRTFQEWVNMLGGKSVNGVPVLFPYDDSVPYHLYWQVLNAKHHGVPQNRERVFLIGIRDDADNRFQFPREEHLTKRLKDVLEDEVFEKFYMSEAAVFKCLKSQANKDLLIKDVSDVSKCIVAGYYKIPFDGQYIKVQSNLEKYFLSEKMIDGFTKHNENHNEKGTGFIFEPKNENDVAACLRANAALCATDNTLRVKSATSKGYEEVREGIWIADYRNDEGLRIRKDNISPCMAARKHSETDISTMAPLIGYNYKIRRLTPRECFRLMDFPDTFTWPVSDSQAYKQAGNSIVVNVLYKILKNLL
jgi:DNA (cytosine-5)-methyltransferase 1